LVGVEMAGLEAPDGVAPDSGAAGGVAVAGAKGAAAAGRVAVAGTWYCRPAGRTPACTCCREPARAVAAGTGVGLRASGSRTEGLRAWPGFSSF
jgi:hypothetical protein